MSKMEKLSALTAQGVVQSRKRRSTEPCRGQARERTAFEANRDFFEAPYFVLVSDRASIYAPTSLTPMAGAVTLAEK